MIEFELDASPDEGIYELVLRADRNAAGERHLPVTSVELEALGRDEPGPALQIEALFGLQGGRRIIAQLDVRMRCILAAGALEPLLFATFERFGGTALTSLSLARKEGDRTVELCDLTLSFSSRLPFLANNLVLVGELASEDETRACQRALAVLGVPVRTLGNALRVTRWQLRKQPSAELQAASVVRAIEVPGVGEVGFYSASIPATQSAALKLVACGETEVTIDLWISKGLARQQAVTSTYCAALEEFLIERAAAVFRSRKWRVRAVVGEPYSGSTASGVLPERKPVEWSLNWGARR
jgi:hypothetical protein